jgi:hypothetical protein
MGRQPQSGGAPLSWYLSLARGAYTVIVLPWSSARSSMMTKKTATDRKKEAVWVACSKKQIASS